MNLSRYNDIWDPWATYPDSRRPKSYEQNKQFESLASLELKSSKIIQKGNLKAQKNHIESQIRVKQDKSRIERELNQVKQKMNDTWEYWAKLGAKIGAYNVLTAKK